MSERIKKIKDNFKIEKFEHDGISYDGVTGISPSDIEYVINELYEIKTKKKGNVLSEEIKQLYN